MARIPVYEQQTSPSGGLAAPNARGVQVASAGAAFGQAAGQAMGAVADALITKERADGDAWGDSSLSQARLDLYQDLETYKNETPAGANGFYKSYMGRFDKYFDDLEKNAPNPYAKERVVKDRSNLKISLGKAALDYEAAEGVRWRTEQFGKGIDTDAQTLSIVPADAVDSEFSSMVAAWEKRLEEESLAPETKAKLQTAMQRQLSEAANMRKIQEDPKRYLDRTKPRAPGLDGFLNLTLEVEGEMNASDGSTGNPALYGINRREHPEAFDEVAALYNAGDKAGAEAKAKGWYQKNIWDKHDLGALPDDVATVVADGLVNHWSGFQKTLLSAARKGASAEELLEMRQKEYDRLKTASPEKYGQSYNGWMTRLDKVAAAASASSDDPVFNAGDYTQQQRWIEEARREQVKNQATYRAQLDAQVKDNYSMVMNGQQSGAVVPMAAFVDAYGEEGVARFDSYQKEITFARDYHDVIRMTPQEAADMLVSRKPQRGPGYADAMRRYNDLQGAASSAMQARAKDPIGFAMEQGIGLDNEPLDFSAGDLDQRLRYRADTAVSMEFTYGTSYQLFTKGEAESLTNFLSTAQPDAQLALIQSIQSAAGGRTAEALGQIAEKDKVFAHVGGLVAAVGDGAMKTAIDTFRGRIGLAQNPNAVDMKQSDAEFRAVVGNAFEYMPENAEALLKTAKSLYYVRALQKGAGGTFDTDVYDMTLSEALGHGEGSAIVTLNDRQTVLPPGVKEDEFEDFLSMLNPADVVDFSATGKPPADSMGRAIPPDKLLEYGQFVTVGTGRYKVLLPDGFARYGNEDYELVVTPERVRGVLAR